MENIQSLKKINLLNSVFVRKNLVIIIVLLLMPNVQATDSSSKIEFNVYYDDILQPTADLFILNKMNNQSIELKNVDLTQGVEISDLSPQEGDYLKVVIYLDFSDPTKVRTICVLYLSNLTVQTINMYSNQANMGDLDVDNSGNNINWDTQNIVVNMKQATPPGIPTVLTLSRFDDAVFRVNYDHTERWIPPCDEGFSWTIDFNFYMSNIAAPSQNRVATDTVDSDGILDGGFCSEPDPPDPTLFDPELTIIIPAPGVPKTDTYHATGSVYLVVDHYIAEYDDDGNGIGWQHDDNRNEQEYGPDCEDEPNCYHAVIITWI